jgi:NarL family two-component system response regulator LiaR
MPDPGTPRIRVLICDDHPIVRQGLQTFLNLQEDMEVVGEASDGEDAIGKARAYRPDVVLMDLVMPNVGGIEAIERMRAESIPARVIVLTSFSDDDKIFPAIRAGATGYLMKDVPPQELAKAIRMAHAGESLLHPDVARRVMEQLRGGNEERADGLSRLTEREIDVLKLIAKGRSNKEIAHDLVLSEKTVKTHVSNILQKLHLSDRTQAALLAVRERLVEP